MISNAITLARTALIVPLYLLLTHGEHRWGALTVFLLAGLMDVADGKVARALGEASAVGAMLDRLADRLLTLTVVAGLVVSGRLAGPFVVAGLVLVGRDLVVGALEGLTPRGPDWRLSITGKIKIALHFIGCTLLIVGAGPWARAGGWVLTAAAVLTLILLFRLVRATLAAAVKPVR